MSGSLRISCVSLATLLYSAATSFGDPTLVSLSGTIAPGGGGNFTTFGNPALGGNSQIAFTSALTGGSSTSGLFTGTPGSVTAVALQATAAPAGGNFNVINAPVIYGSGQLAFSASLTGGSATGGVFAGTAGSLMTVALQGTAAPAGGNYTTFSAPTLNAGGTVAFQAGLTGGSSTSGIFVGTPGSVTKVALLGEPAPAGTPGNFSTVFAQPLLNATGQVAFISLAGSQQGIFAGTPGALQTVMLAGTTAPGTGGLFYGNPATGISYNNSGQVAFSSGLTTDGITGAGTGVFTGAPGAVQNLARTGVAAPGGVGNFGTFFGVSVSNTGQAAFGGSLTGSTSTTAIFTGSSAGNVQVIARNNTVSPTGDTFSSFGSPVPNGVGQFVFTSILSGPNVTAANDSALFAGIPGGLALIVREGDVIDVDPGVGVDLRTVNGAINLLVGSGGADGKGVPFNDAGVVAYRLTFADGSSGVFTSVIPEPAAVALLAVAGVGMLRRRRAA